MVAACNASSQGVVKQAWTVAFRKATTRHMLLPYGVFIRDAHGAVGFRRPRPSTKDVMVLVEGLAGEQSATSRRGATRPMRTGTRATPKMDWRWCGRRACVEPVRATLPAW